MKTYTIEEILKIATAHARIINGKSSYHLDNDDVKSIVHDVSLETYQKNQNYSKSLGGLLSIKIKRRWIDFYRNQHCQKNNVKRKVELLSTTVSQKNADFDNEHVDIWQFVYKLLDKHERALMRMFFLMDMSTEEVAEVYCVNIRTIQREKLKFSHKLRLIGKNINFSQKGVE